MTGELSEGLAAFRSENADGTGGGNGKESGAIGTPDEGGDVVVECGLPEEAERDSRSGGRHRGF